MNVYLFQILILLLFALFVDDKNKKTLYFYKIVFFFTLFILMAFRGNSVGEDTISYSYIYKNVSVQSFDYLLNPSKSRYEVLFAVLIKISSIYGNYYFFQAIISFLFCLGSTIFISRISKDFVFGSFIFLCCGIYLSAFNVSRQMLAVVILLNGWCYLIENKYIKSFLLLVLAFFVHYTSIIFLIPYIFYFITRKVPFTVKLLPLALIAAALNYQLFITYFSDYLLIYDNYLANKKETITGGGIYILWSIVVLLSIYLIYISGKKTDYIVKLSALFSLQYVIAKLIGFEFNYFDRLGAYFMPFIIVVYESTTGCIRNKSISWLFKYSILALYILYYYLSSLSDQYRYEFYF